MQFNRNVEVEVNSFGIAEKVQGDESGLVETRSLRGIVGFVATNWPISDFGRPMLQV